MIAPDALILLPDGTRCPASQLTVGQAVATLNGTTATVAAVTTRECPVVALRTYEDAEPCWHALVVSPDTALYTDIGWLTAAVLPIWTPVAICRKEAPEQLHYWRLREHRVTNEPLTTLLQIHLTGGQALIANSYVVRAERETPA